MTTIGLHVYAIKLHEKSTHKPIRFSSSGSGACVSQYLPNFIKKYSSQVDAGNNRSWYLEPKVSNGYKEHGLIRYGTSGYTEEIRDRNTRALRYNRQPTDIGTIPLYYCFWVPDKGNYGLIALQTFGMRSCVNRFLRAFGKGFRNLYGSISITFSAIMPSQLAKFADGQVKAFSLTKHDYSSDAANNQIGSGSGLVDLDVTFKAKPRGSLGPLRDFTNKVMNVGKEKVLVYNNTYFDEAVAEVQVGKRRRKIVLVGASQNAGKFDLSEDVKTSGGHPVFESIAEECADIFLSVVSV